MGNKILLIDDSVTVQKIITLTFSDEGVDVVTVDSGDEAISRLGYMRPALVMADVSIPGKNGYDVCAFIKGNPELKNIPVVLLVPGFETYDAERARRVGADYHLTKPFQSIRSLITTVKGLIGTSGSGALQALQTGDANADNLLELEPGDSGPLHPAPVAIIPEVAEIPVLPASPALALSGEGEIAPARTARQSDSTGTDDEASRLDRMMEEMVERLAVQIGERLAAGYFVTPAAAAEATTERLVERLAERVTERVTERIIEKIDSISSNLAERISIQLAGQVANPVSPPTADEHDRVLPAPERPPANPLPPYRYEDPDQLLELDDL